MAAVRIVHCCGDADALPLPALAGDGDDPVPVADPDVLDPGRAGFGDPQPHEEEPDEGGGHGAGAFGFGDDGLDLFGGEELLRGVGVDLGPVPLGDGVAFDPGPFRVVHAVAVEGGRGGHHPQQARGAQRPGLGDGHVPEGLELVDPVLDVVAVELDGCPLAPDGEVFEAGPDPLVLVDGAGLAAVGAEPPEPPGGGAEPGVGGFGGGFLGVAEVGLRPDRRSTSAAVGGSGARSVTASFSAAVSVLDQPTWVTVVPSSMVVRQFAPMRTVVTTCPL
jgi:hypothetical protein